MEAIGTLSGGIAHDFNNILPGIFGYSQLAEMDIDNPEKGKLNLAQVVNGARRASELVQQILTFSRQTEFKKHPLSLYIIIKEGLKLLRSSIPSTIETQENIVSKAKIMADPTQMHQIIMNLSTNAYHAMRLSGGVLSVDLCNIDIWDKSLVPDSNMAPGRYLNLRVSDTGYGMDKDILTKIFDPYFTTKKVGEGTGLGLSLVYGIVKEHGGYIKVDSEIDKGSVINVF